MVGNKEKTPATPSSSEEGGWLVVEKGWKSRDYRVCFISSKTIRYTGMLMVVLVYGKDCFAKLGFDNCPSSPLADGARQTRSEVPSTSH